MTDKNKKNQTFIPSLFNRDGFEYTCTIVFGECGPVWNLSIPTEHAQRDSENAGDSLGAASGPKQTDSVQTRRCIHVHGKKEETSSSNCR